MNDIIESEEINWEYINNRFHCAYHAKESVIVFRGENYFALSCGCAYEISTFGTKWRNTTAPKPAQPAE